jgi:tetratricopeptide (TPR) repeat protein
MDINPTASVWFLHGQCLASLGCYDHAEQHFRRGLELEDCSRGRHLLADCLEKVGRHGKAVEEYQRAAQIAEITERKRMRLKDVPEDLTTMEWKRSE